MPVTPGSRPAEPPAAGAAIGSLSDCTRCGRTLAPGALACGRCRALTYADELESLAAEAAAFEEAGDRSTALACWQRALALLPDTAAQADWVRRQIERLELEQRAMPADAAAPSLAQRFLEPAFLGSLGLFVLVASGTFGLAFGVGIAAQILVHEMGHYIDIRRRGLPADMPVFLPGLGAFVRWRALGVPARTRAEVSLAGPLAGWVAAAACAAMAWATADRTWATLAHAGAMLNLLNLMPVWALDGGQAAAALDRGGRWTLLVLCLLLWPLLGQPVFVLVAGGIVYRLAQRDAPSERCLPITVYFAMVLALLGLVLVAAGG